MLPKYEQETRKDKWEDSCKGSDLYWTLTVDAESILKLSSIPKYYLRTCVGKGNVYFSPGWESIWCFSDSLIS